MNIVFMGSPDFAIPSLHAIHQSKHTIVAVVSNVDKRRGRGTSTMPTPVKAAAQELNLPVIEVDDLKSDAFAQQLQQLNADLFVVVAFRILPVSVLQIPRIGSVNLHASLLPKYRGAAPIHWAIMNGEQETGCTIFFLDEKVDTGNIILQQKTTIDDDETTGELYARLSTLGSEALLTALDHIEDNTAVPIPQDDALASPAPKLFKEDAHLTFHQPAINVHNRIRGLSPFPTAWADWEGKPMKIYRSALGPIANVNPGDLFERNGRLLVGCVEGSVELLELQLPGKKRMTAQEFLNGYTPSGTLN
ncbi:MAG: methionyl-tRNA formyltransferase [Bacteroidota bacterium]